MLTLADVRDCIAGLGIAEDDNVYCGKLDNKKDKSIGVYHLKRSGQPNIAIGGMNNTSFGDKGISLLVHWNKSPRETEKVSMSLYEALLNLKMVTINDSVIKFVRVLVPEPIDVGTDDNGIYEMVIECEFYYER